VKHERIILTSEYRDRCIASGLDDATSEIAAANAAIATGDIFTLLAFHDDGSVVRRFGPSLQSCGVESQESGV
jgi:hypothetical protein